MSGHFPSKSATPNEQKIHGRAPCDKLRSLCDFYYESKRSPDDIAKEPITLRYEDCGVKWRVTCPQCRRVLANRPQLVSWARERVAERGDTGNEAGRALP